jgi:hypothetical protein
MNILIQQRLVTLQHYPQKDMAVEFKKIIQNSLLLLCIAGIIVQNVAANTLPVCNSNKLPNGYVLGFFNGVWNSRAQAITGLYALSDNLNTLTYNGAPVSPMLLYNHTGCDKGTLSCAQDVAEVFEQKVLEADPTGTIAGRYEYFWEASTGIQTNFWSALSNLASNLALDSLSNPIPSALTKQIVAGYSYLLSNPPTESDYASQDAALQAVASKGQMMLLVGHSQGNLFLDHAYDHIKPLTVTNGVAA